MEFDEHYMERLQEKAQTKEEKERVHSKDLYS
jgi:hypothetical protein